MKHPLDNPIWSALNSTDKLKNQGTGLLAWTAADLAPFIAMENWNEASQRQLQQQAPAGRSWYILVDHPVNFIPELQLRYHTPLYQFVCTGLRPFTDTRENHPLVPLGVYHVEEMIALTTLTKPGPFLKRTIEFGNYHGIFINDRLAAMGGERLHISPYTEVSAICTHPDFRGRGLAFQITQYLTKLVLEKGQTPFLHVRQDNKTAIELYQRIGFQIRCEIQFYIFQVS